MGPQNIAREIKREVSVSKKIIINGSSTEKNTACAKLVELGRGDHTCAKIISKEFSSLIPDDNEAVNILNSIGGAYDDIADNLIPVYLRAGKQYWYTELGIVIGLGNFAAVSKDTKTISTKVIPYLKAAQSHSVAAVRSRAVESLGAITANHGELARHLLPCMFSALLDKTEVSCAAKETILNLAGKLDPEEIVPFLSEKNRFAQDIVIDFLSKANWKPHDKSNYWLQYMAASHQWEECRKSGEDAIPLLIDAIGIHWSECERISAALKEFGDSVIEPIIKKILQINSYIQAASYGMWQVKIFYLRALKTVGDISDSTLFRAVTFLYQMAGKSEHSEVRAEALKLLGDLSGQNKSIQDSVFQFLSEYFVLLNENDKSDANVERAAIYAVGKLNDKRFTQPLVNIMLHSDSAHKNAAETLQSMGWKPETDEQLVYFILYTQGYKGLTGLGAKSIPALAAAAKSDTTNSYEIIEMIEQLLIKEPCNIPDNHLKMLSELSGVFASADNIKDGESVGNIKVEVSCSNTHKLADAELMRRDGTQAQ